MMLCDSAAAIVADTTPRLFAVELLDSRRRIASVFRVGALT